MTASAKVRCLRKADVRPNAHFGQIVDPNIFSDPTIVTNVKPPRKFDAHTRLDHYPVAYLCTEGTE